MATESIRFVLDGDIIELDEVDPTRTVLQFLREDLGRTGTKEGCAEGDCGACTVVLAELTGSGDDIRLRPVNACIQFLGTLDGKELITVESLARGNAGLHPAQAAMVEQHGSQCGFCTPGFVMSLLVLYEEGGQPTRRRIDDALAGNLCRCTGYRPIIAAARAMHELPANGVQLTHPGQLKSIARGAAFETGKAGRRFLAPTTLPETAQCLADFPDATLLAGGTDIGLWVTKQHRNIDTVIYIGNVRELRLVETSKSHLEIGAAVPLADAIPPLVALYPGLDELFRRFASPPIRNAGTLGGNVANGSPIGDSMPALMVLGTSVVLHGSAGRREVSLDDFYIDYMVNDLKPGEFIEKLRIPLPDETDIVASYKWSKRFDQDISGVCTAYRLRLDDDVVTSIRIACGGMAATVRRAHACEAALSGQTWSQATIDAGMAALARDYAPISDMRATADYRLRAARNLLQRFYLETRGEAGSLYAYGR